METFENLTQELAGRLRNLRKAAGFSSSITLAAEVGWSQSKVSKIETGRTLPDLDDITAWTTACRAGAATDELLDLLQRVEEARNQWRWQLRRGAAAIQRDYEKLHRSASRIRQLELTVIPGMLQTVDYARRRFAEITLLGLAEGVDTEAAVAARVQRQRVLYEQHKRFTFVIDESVLRRRTCPPDVMRAQLERLLVIQAMPNVTLALLPFSAELPITPQRGFILFDDTAVTEDYAGQAILEGERASPYIAAMDLLMEHAVTGRLTAEIVEAARTELDPSS